MTRGSLSTPTINKKLTARQHAPPGQHQQYQEVLRQVKHVTGLMADLQVISLSELTVKDTNIRDSEQRNRANVPKGSKAGQSNHITDIRGSEH